MNNVFKNSTWTQSQEEIKALDPVGTEVSYVSKDKNGKFWFWDETLIDMCGPFDTIEQAANAGIEYSKLIYDGMA